MRLIVERGKVVPLESLPPKSIALDGYVQGPAVDAEFERYSFDHHGGCVRFATSATCKMVLDALLLGLDPTDFAVYVNDVDGDTALSVWLLKNPSRAKENRVRRVVEAVASADAHGPAYPVFEPDWLELFRTAMWPETAARRTKEYWAMDLGELLERCVKNIDAMFDPTRIEFIVRRPDTRRYEVTHRGTGGWVMAKSEDGIFDLLYRDGFTKAIAYQELRDGSISYTVAKRSEFVAGFPIPKILAALAEREPGWGGSSTTGGAPRNQDGSRSRLSPDEVFAIVENVLNS
jgi:hypothetical protein